MASPYSFDGTGGRLTSALQRTRLLLRILLNMKSSGWGLAAEGEAFGSMLQIANGKVQMKKLLFLISLILPCLALSSQAADLPKGAESQFAQVNGIRMHYVKMGEGPLLILLHGWPQTWYEWNDVMPALADKFTVIAPDLRGLGLSEKTPTGYDKHTLAKDVAALIKHLGEKS